MNLLQLKELGFFEDSPSESSGYLYTRQPTNDLDFLRLLDEKEDLYRLPAQMMSLRKNILSLATFSSL